MWHGNTATIFGHLMFSSGILSQTEKNNATARWSSKKRMQAAQKQASRERTSGAASERHLFGQSTATAAATVATTASAQLLKFAYLIILIAIAPHTHTSRYAYARRIQFKCIFGRKRQPASRREWPYYARAIARMENKRARFP